MGLQPTHLNAPKGPPRPGNDVPKTDVDWEKHQCLCPHGKPRDSLRKGSAGLSRGTRARGGGWAAQGRAPQGTQSYARSSGLFSQPAPFAQPLCSRPLPSCRRPLSRSFRKAVFLFKLAISKLPDILDPCASFKKKVCQITNRMELMLPEL